MNRIYTRPPREVEAKTAAPADKRFAMRGQVRYRLGAPFVPCFAPSPCRQFRRFSRAMSRSQSLNFKKLVEVHFASLYRFAYCLANDEQTACDLTQHTFFLYANKGASIRDGHKVKSWLYSTLHNEYLRQRAAPHVEHPPAPPAIRANSALTAPENVAALDGPSAAALFAKLDESVRPPLALFYLQELTYGEISDVLGAPLADIQARVADGKAQLKKLLAGRASHN